MVASQPTVLDPRTDASRVAQLRRSALFVHDTIEQQLRDLVTTRSPQTPLSGVEVDDAVALLLDGRDREDYGRWVHYPWSGRLVHLLGPAEYRELRLDRNRHKLTAGEQATLAGVTIGIAGLSVGNAVALTLALEGVGGHLRLADFDCLDLSNMNRIRAGVHDIGLPKVALAARQIAEFDPYLELSLLPDGVTTDNIDAFMLGSDELGPPLDIVIDECDGLAQKFLLRERARELRLAVLMETSDRGLLDIERFDHEPQRPLLHGRMEGRTSTEVAALLALPTEVAQGHRAAIVAELVDGDLLSTRLAATMLEAGVSVSSWPQLASDVQLGGASTTAAARRLALGQPLASGRRYVDLERILGSDLQSPATGASTTAALPALGAAHPERGDEVPDLIRHVVEQAVLAPSAANTQPWHFNWDGERLWIVHDVERSSMLLDPRGHGALLALGAALENAVVAAAGEGFATVVEPFPIASSSHVVAALAFAPDASEALASLAQRAPLVARRRTDRRLGPRRASGQADLAALTAAAREHGADLLLRDDQEALAELGSIAGMSDRIAMLCPETNAELAATLRWSAAQALRTRDGVDLPSLHPTPGARAAAALAARPDVVRFLGEIDGGARFEQNARQAFAAASAGGLLVLADDTSQSWLAGGRAMQRIWLEATARGLALQPLSIVLRQLEMLGAPAASVLREGQAADLGVLDERLRRVFDHRDGVAALLFRVTHLDGEPEPSLRLPAAAMLSAGAPA